MAGQGKVNALTVDVEDYFQVAGFADRIAPSEWGRFTPRVEYNTFRLLELFDYYNVKATFFVLGWVAERFPKLIKTIASENHEIACHGYSHRLIYNQYPAEFRAETHRAKTILEDLIQKPIIGYRAASYSITRESEWALDILVEQGFTYDSSIVPVHHDRYGMPGTEPSPHLLKRAGGSIIEFPPSTLNLFGMRIPIGGGGYFRLYPYALTRAGLAYLNTVRKEPFIFYVHPWEIDPGQTRIQARPLSRFRHYVGLKSCERKLRSLLAQFVFTTVEDVMQHLSVWRELTASERSYEPLAG